MVFWSLVALAPVLDNPGLRKEEESFMCVSNLLMVSYCLEVVEARRALALVIWNIVRPLLVTASAIRSR